MLPRRRHKICEPIEKLKRREIHDAIRAAGRAHRDALRGPQAVDNVLAAPQSVVPGA